MAEKRAVQADWIEAALARYERPLIRYVTRITGDLDRARDVVQDTFLKLVKTERAKVEQHLAAWLFTVAKNRALDISKKERRMGHLENTEVVPDTAPGPQDAAQSSEMLARIFEALDTLSEDHKEAFRLKFQDQLTYREISEIMGKSLGTVSKLITTALCTVRDRLMAGGVLRQES
jgi:RNA polymerase sigma-70 factor (ECF subfamily)